MTGHSPRPGWRSGETHHRAKLSDADVVAMRHQRQRYGDTYADLAARFGCGESTARDIVTYRTRYRAHPVPSSSAKEPAP